MANYLIKTTEIYRCDSEAEAKNLIEEAKQNSLYTVTKSSSEIRTLKQKGEVVDEWRRVTITKAFAEEKEPYGQVYVSYDTTRGEKVESYED
jgi:hypothetical protein